MVLEQGEDVEVPEAGEEEEDVVVVDNDEEVGRAEDHKVDIDHPDGGKPKRNSWDKECTVNLLKGVKR
jgi:hypothetical protein